MNHDPSRLRQNQQTGQTQAQNIQAPQVKTFASVEEVLRQDASQIEVPARVEERLKQSLAGEILPKKSWWHRWINPGKP